METSDLLTHLSKFREQQKAFRKIMKERKTKIRKFMLLINNMLNDNEEGFSHLERLMREMEKSTKTCLGLKSPAKIQPESSQVLRKSKIKRVQILTPEILSPKSSARNDEIIVPETLAVELENVTEQNNRTSTVTIIPETQLLADETCFSEDEESVSLNTSNNPSSEVLPSDDPNQSPGISSLSTRITSIQHDSGLSDETYQLLNELMNNADNADSKRNVTILKSPGKQKPCKRRRIEIVDTPEENRCTSPVVVKDVQVIDENIISQEKPKMKWPIGYKKKPVQGELVVEPASGNRKPFRARQTKLDSFLAKPSTKSRRSQSNSQRSQDRLDRQQRVDSRPSASPSQPEQMAQQSLDLEVTLSALPNPKPKDVTRAVDDSFDMLPPTASPSKSSKKRKGVGVKRERGLGHYGCEDCQQILVGKKLTPRELIPRLRALCDHLPDKPPMETPPKYWNMSFATSSLDIT